MIFSRIARAVLGCALLGAASSCSRSSSVRGVDASPGETPEAGDAAASLGDDGASQDATTLDATIDAAAGNPGADAETLDAAPDVSSNDASLPDVSAPDAQADADDSDVLDAGSTLDADAAGPEAGVACEPDSTRCVGSDIQRCSPSGRWDAAEACPSEAEWEYAAAGGEQQRQYAWGSTPPGAANQYAIYGCDYPSGSGTCSTVANIAAVGTATLGVGRWGQLDLAGEMWEPIVDESAPYANPCSDCAYLQTTPDRVLRGGGFIDTLNGPASRFDYPPSSPGGELGIRCARAP
jgi:hypothetical protein